MSEYVGTFLNLVLKIIRFYILSYGNPSRIQSFEEGSNFRLIDTYSPSLKKLKVGSFFKKGRIFIILQVSPKRWLRMGMDGGGGGDFILTPNIDRFH